jgi:deoxyribonuclease V
VWCCLDVDYGAAGVTAAGVGFDAWTDAVARIEIVVRSFAPAAPYQPGAFYERELPHLLAVLARMPELDGVIVDAYAWLGADRPGLGARLHEACGRVVIGVAKTAFAGADELRSAALGPHRTVEIARPGSARPLYVSAAGLDPAEAAERVRGMHGDHRIPTLLRRADALARQPVA